MKPERFAPRILVLAVLLLAIQPAGAQLRLPGLPLPDRIGPVGLGELGRLQRPAESLLDRTALPDLQGLRLEQVTNLLARHPDVLAPDALGNPTVRGEILAWSPGAAGLAVAKDAGMTVAREQDHPELGHKLVVLRMAPGGSAAGLLAMLRTADPQGIYDLNHVFTGSGAGGAPAAPGTGAGAPHAGGPAVRVGLVDSGVDRAHPVFDGVAVRQWGCGGTPHPAPHGTAVAALMVGRSDHFSGAAPGAGLFAADVYCNEPVGGSVDRITAALAWLAREEVGVINISLVGPHNAALGRAVQAMLARGHLLVAAVGNDGPAAPALYPASYAGVVGVSGVDRRGRVLPEAGRGPQVMFAAPGSQMVSAVPGTPPYRQVRGTSYAAPIVSAMLAPRLARPSREAAQRALAELGREATRADAASVSNATGLGIVGAGVRTDPARLR